MMNLPTLHLARLGTAAKREVASPGANGKRRLPERFSVAVVLGAALVSFTLIGGSGIALHRAWVSAHATSEASLERVAQVVESTVNRQLMQVDSALASLPALLASVQEASGSVSPRAASRLLQGFNFHSLAFRDLALLQEDGRIWAAARPHPGESASLPSLESGSDIGVRVRGPARNPLTGEWSLYLSRRVVLPDGEAYLAVAEMPLSKIATLLSEAGGGASLRIRLERPSGQVLVSLPHNERLIGKGTDGVGPGRWDGRTWEEFDPDLATTLLKSARPTLYSDIIVVVATDAGTAIASWQRDRDRVVAVVSFAELLVLALTAGLLAALRKRRQLEDDRTRAHRRLESAIDAMSDGFAMWDEDDRLITCNQKYRELYALTAPFIAPGMTFEEMMRKGAENGQYPHVDGSSDKWLTDTLEWHGKAEGSLERELPGGHWVLAKERRTESGEIVGIRTDITVLKQALAELEASKADAESRNAALVEQERQIRFLAHHDALTGLPNRVLFRQRLEELLRQRKEADAAAVLLYLDLDKFKEVNDTLGHPVGDMLLVSVAERLQASLRDVDLVARLGGDEFAVASLLADPQQQASEISDRIVKALSAPFMLKGRSITIGVSIGIKVARGTSTDPDNLLRSADMALYEAKLAGRGQWKFFEASVETKVLSRVQMQRDLEAALGTDQFLMHYQPVFDIAKGTVCGFEALMRWNHPDRGFVSPGEFIPLAEETGLIKELGAFALERACLDAATLPSHIRMAVNLSPVQLESDDIYGRIADIITRSGLEPTRLELEITESALVDDSDRAARLLHRLRDLGARIVLDDFGTGYSALSYLRKFPFGKIKIDQSFVREMAVRPDSAAIVNLIVGLADQLGMSTTAEGVETAEQLALIRKAGCREAQGFLLGRPKSILHSFANLESTIPGETLERLATA